MHGWVCTGHQDDKQSILSAGSSQPQVGVMAGNRNCKTSLFFGDSQKDGMLPVTEVLLSQAQSSHQLLILTAVRKPALRTPPYWWGNQDTEMPSPA